MMRKAGQFATVNLVGMAVERVLLFVLIFPIT